jgi:hypothetical protein
MNNPMEKNPVKIKLPGKLGKLLIQKKNCPKQLKKLKKKYPENKYTLTLVMADNKQIGYLLCKVKDATLGEIVKQATVSHQNGDGKKKRVKKKR